MKKFKKFKKLIKSTKKESEYVSAHLNEWIDLIFGFKQKGKEAISVHNVFYYLTYEGSVDLKAIQDPLQKASAKAQIEEYGQTPKQMFSKPHPKRLPLESTENNTNIEKSIQSSKPEEYNIVTKSTRRILYLKSIQQKILIIYENGSVALNKMVQMIEGNLPFKFELDKTLGSTKEKQINLNLRKEGTNVTNYSETNKQIQFESPKSTYSNLFAVCPNLQNLISCGNWENSFVCSEITANNITPIFSSPTTEHLDRITCIALGNDGNTLVTGSVDNTCLLWKIGAALSGKPVKQTGNWFSPIDYIRSSASKKSEIASQLEPTFRLCGHDDKITCVSICTSLGIVVSGSRDGTCIIWKSSNARYLCTLFFRDVIVDNSNVLSNKCYVEQSLISSRGRIISKTYNLNKNSPKPYYNIFVHTTYGTLQSKQQFNKRINAMQISDNGLYLVLAVDQNCLVLDPNDLQLINSYECDSPIFSFEFAHNDSYLLVGKDNGRLSILPTDNWRDKKF